MQVRRGCEEEDVIRGWGLLLGLGIALNGIIFEVNKLFTIQPNRSINHLLTRLTPRNFSTRLGSAMPSPGSKRRVTLKDIAHAAGLTHGAVSLALRNSPRISEATRKRVQKMARKMGYQPNAMAIGLAQFKRTSSTAPIQAAIAWLNFWPDPKDLRRVPLFDANWRGAVEAAESLGYHLEEFVCDETLPPKRLKSILFARGIRGILLPPQRPPIHQKQFNFDWSRFAAIRFGHTIPYPPVHMVTHSQASDTLMAVRKMEEKGYQRIGHVSSATIRSFALFDAGFLKLRETLPDKNRLPLLTLPDWAQATPEVLDMIDAWMKKWKPDAILSTEGNTKLLLTTAGYHVPGDVGLASTSVSNGDVNAGVFENPEEVGRAAVNNLVALIQRNEFGIPEFRHDILVRGRWEDGSDLPERR